MRELWLFWSSGWIQIQKWALFWLCHRNFHRRSILMLLFQYLCRICHRRSISKHRIWLICLRWNQYTVLNLFHQHLLKFSNPEFVLPMERQQFKNGLQFLRLIQGWPSKSSQISNFQGVRPSLAPIQPRNKCGPWLEFGIILWFLTFSFSVVNIIILLKENL